MLRSLTLTEYDTESKVALSPAERDALSRIAPSIRIVPRSDLQGYYDLTPGATVGAVWLDQLTMVIRPKIEVNRLLFLLSYSLYRRNWPQFSFRADPAAELVEAIVAAFLTHANRALQWGLLRGYKVEEDASTAVRGRIRFDDQLRDQFGIMPPVCITYDEFTEDILENRLIKAAANRLLRLGIRRDAHRTAIAGLLTSLRDVSLVDYDARRIPDLTYTRLNEHYRPVVELSRLIVRASSFELRHGRVFAGAMLFDMNVVFEDFVVEALRDALQVTVGTFPQQAKDRTLVLDEGGRINLQPDLSWWDGPTCAFVGDVKYKRTKSDDALNPDLYQVLAYCVAANLPASLLIYAAGEVQPEPHLVRHLGKTLEVVTIDLKRTPEQILAEIRAIAGRIRAMRSQVSATQWALASGQYSDTGKTPGPALR